MPVTVIALLAINEDDPMALSEYLQATAPIVERAKGRVGQRFDLTVSVGGRGPMQTLVVIEYPDRAAIQQVFFGESFHSMTPIRNRAFSEWHFMIPANDGVGGEGSVPGPFGADT